MKIGIITFHRADNYGALLQAYALQEELCKQGHDVRIIDYRCIPLEMDYRWLYRPIPKPTRNIGIWMKELMHRLPCLTDLRAKRDKCELFRNQYLRMTNSVISDNDKEKIEGEFDLILTGSDQIWNYYLTHGADKWYAYKRACTPEVCTLASYAASIGNMERFQNHIEEYKPALLEYDSISVRERISAEYLERCLQKSIYMVLDPTLIVEPAVWWKLANTYTPLEKDYILLYGVVNNEIANSIALKLASETGKSVVHFEQALRKKNNTVYAQNSGPVELINYIANADYVVTSSFHGTVFSIMLQKQFVTIPTPVDDPRVLTILCALGLENRMMQGIGDYKKERVDAKIDYADMDKKLESLKRNSIDYLNMCLSIAERKRKARKESE